MTRDRADDPALHGHALFGEGWAAAWRERIEGSDAYRRAGAEWEGTLVLVAIVEGQPPPAVWAELRHGSCLAARAATSLDTAAASFVLEAPVAVWRRLFDGELDPIWGLLSRKLRLAKGDLMRLTPHAGAARELVAAARLVPTAFPDSGGGGTVARRAPSSRPAAAASPAAAAPTGAVAASAPPGAASVAPAVAGGAGPGARALQTTSRRGLDRTLLPMRLWEKAKARGIWNPSALALDRDRADWRGLTEDQRDVVLRLCSMFQAGEESVTLDLLPLIEAVAAEGRLEEEIFLTSFLWEEAKHVDFFRRFFDEVAETREDLTRYHTPSYRRLIYEALPEALDRLRRDRSPVAQAEASVTYNLVVEGVLAETGYHAFARMLRERGLLPGVQQGVAWLKSDESRHLAYGVYLLGRLVAEHGEPVWQAIERRMESLLPAVLGTVEEIFAAYPTMPFGLRQDEFLQFATRQSEARLRRIEQARRQSLAEALAADVPDLEEA